ncbi:MAG: FAD-dependent oxidoreductase, partial [Ignavibacteriales bacterium]|nr:FAD-dependent oxidoreductase [Ignavibacteriales bacterium]
MEIKKFDYIVYFASLAGVVFSIQKARLGKKVLLLNQVGFPGGSITENLNLEQNIPVEIKSYTMLNIIKKIKKYSNGILFQKETQVILNPEAVKFVLQDELTNSNVNLLFHIRLNKIEIKENSFIVSVVGREGELTFECENLIDASEEFSMSDLGKVGERKLQFRRYNLVTSLIANEEFLNKDYLIGKIKIDDGRYWLSLKNEEKDE